MTKKNKIWSALIIVVTVSVVGIIILSMRSEADSEKEDGYLIRQTKEEQNVSRA